MVNSSGHGYQISCEHTESWVARFIECAKMVTRDFTGEVFAWLIVVSAAGGGFIVAFASSCIS